MNDNKAQKMNKNDTHQRFSQENKNKNQNRDHHNKKKSIIHVSKWNDNQWRVFDQQNQHTPRGRQNRDHSTNEDIRDHHNQKEVLNTPWTPKPEQKFKLENTLCMQGTKPQERIPKQKKPKPDNNS